MCLHTEISGIPLEKSLGSRFQDDIMSVYPLEAIVVNLDTGASSHRQQWSSATI